MADANFSPFGQPCETVRISRRDFDRLPPSMRDFSGDKLAVLTSRNGRCVKLPVEIVRVKGCSETIAR